MQTTVISKSNKRRFPARYSREGKIVDYKDFPRNFKQVVMTEETGRKKKNGKPKLRSVTRHTID